MPTGASLGIAGGWERPSRLALLAARECGAPTTREAPSRSDEQPAGLAAAGRRARTPAACRPRGSSRRGTGGEPCLRFPGRVEAAVRRSRRRARPLRACRGCRERRESAISLCPRRGNEPHARRLDRVAACSLCVDCRLSRQPRPLGSLLGPTALTRRPKPTPFPTTPDRIRPTRSAPGAARAETCGWLSDTPPHDGADAARPGWLLGLPRVRPRTTRPPRRRQLTAFPRDHRAVFGLVLGGRFGGRGGVGREDRWGCGCGRCLVHDHKYS